MTAADLRPGDVVIYTPKNLRRTVTSVTSDRIYLARETIAGDVKNGYESKRMVDVLFRTSKWVLTGPADGDGRGDLNVTVDDIRIGDVFTRYQTSQRRVIANIQDGRYLVVRTTGSGQEESQVWESRQLLAEYLEHRIWVAPIDPRMRMPDGI